MLNQKDDTDLSFEDKKTDENINIESLDTDQTSMVETVYSPTESLAPEKDYSRAGFSMLTFLLSWQFVVVAVTALKYNLTDKGLTIGAALALSLAAELIGILLYYSVIKSIKYDRIQEKKLGFSHLFCCYCIALFIGIAGNVIGIVMNSVISSKGMTPSLDNLDQIAESNLTALFIYGVLIAPFLEELVCRKLLLDRIYKFNKPVAVLTSGLFFGLMHGNLQQFFYTLFLGAFLAFIYVKTGKLKYTILIHMTVNGFSLLLTWFVSKVPLINNLASGSTEVVDKLLKDKTQLTFFILLVFFALLEYVFAFIGLIILITHLKDFSFDEQHENRQSILKCWGNFGMIVAYLVMFAIMILPIFNLDVFDRLFNWLVK